MATHTHISFKKSDFIASIIVAITCGLSTILFFGFSTHLHPSADNDPGIFWAASPILFSVPAVIAFGLTAFICLFRRSIKNKNAA